MKPEPPDTKIDNRQQRDVTYGHPIKTLELRDRTKFGIVFGPVHYEESNTHHAKMPDGSYLPFDGWMHPTDVRIESFNQIRDGIVVKGGEVRIHMLGNLIYAYPFYDIYEAITRLPMVLRDLLRLTPMAAGGWTIENIQRNIIGRNVWYRDQPGVITEFYGARGSVLVKPDGPDGFTQPNYIKQMVDEVLPLDEACWVDILSPELYWWRDPEAIL